MRKKRAPHSLKVVERAVTARILVCYRCPAVGWYRVADEQGRTVLPAACRWHAEAYRRNRERRAG